MIVQPFGARVWLATGATDKLRGMNGLALRVQQALQLDPHGGDLYIFRGKRWSCVTLRILPVRGRAVEGSMVVVPSGGGPPVILEQTTVRHVSGTRLHDLAQAAQPMITFS
jgi:hypothetical protein